jgi:osmotically-inducible protein OsmY
MQAPKTAGVRGDERVSREVDENCMDESTHPLDAATRDAQHRAQSALSDSSILDLRELRVEVTEESLIIYGSVSSFYHKQVAQEMVRAVVDEIAVVNSVHVR